MMKKRKVLASEDADEVSISKKIRRSTVSVSVFEDFDDSAVSPAPSALVSSVVSKQLLVLSATEADVLAVGSKKLNDEQYCCHRGLQSAVSLVEYNQILQFYCKHDPKCWTVRYQGVFSDAHSWAVS